MTEERRDSRNYKHQGRRGFNGGVWCSQLYMRVAARLSSSALAHTLHPTKGASSAHEWREAIPLILVRHWLRRGRFHASNALDKKTVGRRRWADDRRKPLGKGTLGWLEQSTESPNVTQGLFACQGHPFFLSCHRTAKTGMVCLPDAGDVMRPKWVKQDWPARGAKAPLSKSHASSASTPFLRRDSTFGQRRQQSACPSLPYTERLLSPPRVFEWRDYSASGTAR